MIKNSLPLIRTNCRQADLSSLLDLAKRSRFFYDHEILVLKNLCEEHFLLGEDTSYHFLLLNQGGRLIGFACYGLIEEAEDNYDLYWMVVDPEEQRQGHGKLLLRESESGIRALGGRQVNIETSSRELYLPTRKFYESQGYLQSASLPDYYAIGDHKICYYKNL